MTDFKDQGPHPFVTNIEEDTLANEYYRQTLWTGKNMQMTVMSIQPGDDIGLEVHEDHDQFLRIEEGLGLVQMGDAEDSLDFEENVEDDFIVMVPAGKWHNITNTGDKPLKVYSIYAPAEHPHGTVHKTKEEAEADEHHH